MRLLFVVCSFVLFTSVAQAQSNQRTSIAVPPVRMAVVIVGPQALVSQVQEELTLPLSAVAQIVQTSDYRRAAAHIGIARHPRSNRAAPFVGRALGAQYVLLIDGLVVHGEEGRMLFMGVRLIHTASSQVLLGQRYFLPDGKLTPSTAEAIRARLVQMVGPQLDGLLPEPRTPANLKEGHRAPLPGPKPADPMPKAQGRLPSGVTVAPKPKTRRSPSAQHALAKPPHWRKSWLHVNPQLLWRRASLRPQDTDGPPIFYGAGHKLGRALAGGRMGLGFYVGRLGAEVDFAAGRGAYSQTIDGVADQASAQRYSLRTAVAMEVFSHSDARVAPRMGLVYDVMPITMGPFVGLRYLAATLGVRLATPLYAHTLQWEGTVDYLFVGSLGLEAARAGKPGFAQGVMATLGPVIWWGPWRMALSLGVDTRVAHFQGATSLYAPVRYAAMQLSDTLLQLAWQVGIGW